MKTYSTIEQINADIVNNVLTVKDDVTFKVSFSIYASISVEGDITALDINACNINAVDINARDITAWDITAWDISARDISFYAVCFAYTALVCKSIVGRRENSKYFCLDSEVIIKN